MLLLKNKFIQVIYLILSVPILLFFPLMRLKVINPDIDITGEVFLITYLLFFILGLMLSINAEGSSRRDRIKILSLILLIPLLSSIIALIFQFDLWILGIFIITLILNIHGFILLKWNFLFFIFSLIIFAFFFKTTRIYGANLLLSSIAPLIFINIVIELIRTRKIKTYRREYFKLFIIQAVAFISLTGSYWFLFANYGNYEFGKIMVYIYFFLNLYLFIILPNSNFVNWDPILKSRFINHSVYAGGIFLIIAIFISLSDTVGYDILDLFSKNYFPDYAIDFSKSIIIK